MGSDVIGAGQLRHYLELPGMLPGLPGSTWNVTWIIWKLSGGVGQEESEEEEKEEKTKNTRFATKIGTKINFGTANSKIVVPSSENLQMKVKKKKKKKKRKMLGSQRKLVPRLNSVRRIQKLWSQDPKIFRRR